MSSANQFIEVSTVHRASISWWWSVHFVHDNAYRCDVNNTINTAIRDAELKYSVEHNTRYCCQFEGVEITGKCLENVKAAAQYIAKILIQHKGVRPL